MSLVRARSRRDYKANSRSLVVQKADSLGMTDLKRGGRGWMGLENIETEGLATRLQDRAKLLNLFEETNELK